MNPTQIEATFDRQAATYDTQWVKLTPFRDGIHLLLGSLFSQLPVNARMLCVGAGTGAEIHFLANLFPTWTFTAVEPSSGMVSAARQRAEAHGYADRCNFHQGYVESLPHSEPFDCATSLLVSQFLLVAEDRRQFFHSIAKRLKNGGLLVSSDLSFDVKSPEYPAMLAVWLRTLATSDIPPDRQRQMEEAYARDVSILPQVEVAEIITSGGFERLVQFYQAGLIHAWYAHRSQR